MLTQVIAALCLSQAAPATPLYTQSTTNSDGIVEMRTEAQRFIAAGKPDVWLVGAIHIGSKKYYSDLQALLDTQEAVLYEGVKPSKNAPPPAAKPDPNGPKPVYQVLSDSLGLVFQLNEIKYNRPNWVNSDLSMDDLDKLNKEKGNGKPTSFDTIKQILDPNSQMAKSLTTMLTQAADGTKEALKLVIAGVAGSGKTPGLDATMQEIVIQARNKAALDVFAKTISSPTPPKSVAIFYGAMHMPDMEKNLVSTYGYKPAEQKWFLAVTGDKKKMDAQGKQLYELFQTLTSPQKSARGGLLAAFVAGN